MKRFAPEQLAGVLEAVDDHLACAAEITIIGGSALAIGYGVRRATNDIDTFESDLREVELAPRRVRRATGLEIPIANSTIAQLPEGANGASGSCRSSPGSLCSFSTLVTWRPPSCCAAMNTIENSSPSSTRCTRCRSTC